MWVRVLALAAALTVAAGCGQDDVAAMRPASTPTMASPTASPSASPSAESKDLNDLVEIAPGRKLHIHCEGPTAGAGQGTILLEAGGGSGAGNWPPQLIQALGEHARVCAYDRAGTGASSAAPDGKRTMADVVSDLDLLLDAAGIKGRLLLVGTSFGGEVAFNWALHHAGRTAGLVILDTDWPTTDESKTVYPLLPAKQRAEEKAGNKWDAPDNVEHFDYENAAAEDEAAFRTLPGIPIRIVSAQRSYDCDQTQASCRQLQARTVELQKQWLQLSPTARQRVVDSTHDVVFDATDVVVEEILAALDEADFAAA
ncbi:MAG TPA: alpha/beta hydrolase, partial [Sporichthya sp.]|nr:alpha/beta hydrolase [Sporichthya sp.]